MRFSWKIFFLFTAILSVAFSVFGVMMIDATFNQSLERQIERGDMENQLFRFALETGLQTMALESDGITPEAQIQSLGKSLASGLGNGETILRIYDAAGNELFASTDSRVQSGLLEAPEAEYGGYKVLTQGDRYHLAIMSRLDSTQHSTYFLESIADITHLYADRTALYRRYALSLGLLLGVGSMLVLLFSRLLTRSIVRLQRTARRLSRGDLAVRARVRGHDEIADLAVDFNRMADSLAHQMRELADTARKQEDFTAAFAHELKTPLTSIIGYADAICTLDLTRDETLEAAQYIRTQGRRLESLSLKMMDLIVAQSQPLVRKKLQAAQVLADAAAGVFPAMVEKGVDIRTKVEKGVLYGDRDLIISLIINLLDNARKATPAGGTVLLLGEARPQGYRVTVEDTGRGIPKDQIARITEAFYMVDKSRARKEGGAGLGMALCSRIVTLHEAHWHIESEEGRGTRITVDFGRKEGEDG